MTILRCLKRFVEKAGLEWLANATSEREAAMPPETPLNEVVLYTWEEKRNAVADTWRELPEDSELREEIAKDFVEMAHSQHSLDENPDETVVVWIET